MKTSIVLSTIIMTLSSFTIGPKRSENAAAAEQLGQQVVAALQKQSVQEYAFLYPTADAFLKLMDEDAGVYGNNLGEAKRDFEIRYKTKVLPALNRSFFDILEEGKVEGLDWKNVKLTEVKTGQTSETGTPIELLLTSNHVSFSIRFERTIMIDGQFKISPFVSINK